MNLLMISIGDIILTNPSLEAINRQKNYAKSFHSVDMIVFSPKSNDIKLKKYDNLTIYSSNSRNMLTFVFDVLKIAKKIAKTKKIDIITTQDPFGTALAGYLISKRCKSSLHIQNHSSFLNNKLWINEKKVLFTIFNKISHFTLKKADRLRVVNDIEKQRYIDILGIDKDKIDVAPVPVEVKFWQEKPSEKSQDEFVQKYNIDTTLPIVSWAGRAVQVKNLDLLYKSVANISQKTKVNFLVATDTTNSYYDFDKLEQKYEIKPIYLGYLSHEELRVMYSLTDVYLHTSHYEGFGLVMSDAQSCGCVVVSAKICGAMQIIEDEKSGYLVDVSSDDIDTNSAVFSQKVLSLLDDKEKLKNMSIYAQNLMQKKFDKNKMYQDIINSIKNSKN